MYFYKEFSGLFSGVVIFNGCITIFLEISIKPNGGETIIAYSGIRYKFFGVKESSLFNVRLEVFVWTIDNFQIHDALLSKPI
jgi:hypothetical protein